MVYRNITTTIATHAPIDCVTTIDYLLHMFTHIVSYHTSTVLPLITTILVGTVLKDDLVVVGHMVVQVTATTKFLLTLTTLIGVHCSTKFDCMFATHMHGPCTTLHALTLPVTEWTLTTGSQGYHNVTIECLTALVVIFDWGLATIHYLAMANTNTHILNKGWHVIKFMLNF